MIFEMLDEDDSGYIEMEEYTHAIRGYAKVSEQRFPAAEAKKVFAMFDCDGNGQIEKHIFDHMWKHTLAEAANPYERKHLIPRATHAIEESVKNEEDRKKRKKRTFHIKIIKEQALGKTLSHDFLDKGMKGARAETLADIESGMGMDTGGKAYAGSAYTAKDANLGSTMKILFSWGQILSSFKITFTIPWPRTFDQLMSAIYAPFNIDLFAFFGDFKCVVDTSYYSQFYYHMRVPIGMIFVMALAYITAILYKLISEKLFHKIIMYDSKTLNARGLKVLNFVLFVMYPGIGLRIFRVFATTQYGEHRYMQSDLTIRTDQAEYKEMYNMAVFWAFLYVIGIPATYVVILYRNRKIIKEDPDYAKAE